PCGARLPSALCRGRTPTPCRTLPSRGGKWGRTALVSLTFAEWGSALGSEDVGRSGRGPQVGRDAAGGLGVSFVGRIAHGFGQRLGVPRLHGGQSEQALHVFPGETLVEHPVGLGAERDRAVEGIGSGEALAGEERSAEALQSFSP